MSVLDVLAVLAVAALAAGPILIRPSASSVLSDEGFGPLARRLFRRFAVLAGLAGLLAGVSTLWVSFQPDPCVVAATNASLVAGPAFFWAGMRQLRQPSIVPGWAASAAMVATFTASAIVSFEIGGVLDGTTMRLVLVALGCSAVATEAFLLPARSIPGFRVIGALFAIYGTYSLLRLLIWSAFGADNPLYRVWFAPVTVGSLSLILVSALIAATVWSDHTLGERARRLETLSRRLNEYLARGPVTVYRVAIPDLPLVRAAFGSPAAVAVEWAARSALSTATENALSRHTPEAIYAALPGDVHVGGLEESVTRAAGRAVPGLDYREALDVQFARAVVHSSAELAAVWPEMRTPNWRYSSVFPAPAGEPMRRRSREAVPSSDGR